MISDLWSVMCQIIRKIEIKLANGRLVSCLCKETASAVLGTQKQLVMVATALCRCLFQFAFASASQIRFWPLSIGCQHLIWVNWGFVCMCFGKSIWYIFTFLIRKKKYLNTNLELYTFCWAFRSQVLSIAFFLQWCNSLSICMQNVPYECVILQATMWSVMIFFFTKLHFYYNSRNCGVFFRSFCAFRSHKHLNMVQTFLLQRDISYQLKFTQRLS